MNEHGVVAGEGLRSSTLALISVVALDGFISPSGEDVSALVYAICSGKISSRRPMKQAL